jgi:bile acid-coenzyme A ligase
LHTAAQCPAWLKQHWIDWLGAARIWEYYSSSESVGSTLINGTDWLKHRGSVGRVEPGSELAVIDAAGRRCAPGEVGEIFFKPQAGVGFSYLGAEARLVDGWMSVGDLGHLDDEGFLYIADRRTDMIVSGGINVYPAEIEAALESHPQVLSSVVVGLPDDDLGQKVHAIVQIDNSSGTRVTQEELRDFLGNLLVRFKIPRSFEFVDEGLRDSAGKVRRSALRDERIVRRQTSTSSDSTIR